MTTLLAVDPGDKHVGVALFKSDPWSCVDALEMDPPGFLVWLANGMLHGTFDIVVYERFILEAARAPMLVGSELETSQMIGAIKWIFEQCSTNNAWPNYQPVLVGQTNKIKAPTRGVLRSRGIKSTAKRLKAGSHAADAEIHGWHYILHTLEGS